MTDDGFRDSDLEHRAQREGKSLAELLAEGRSAQLSHRACPACSAAAVQVVYGCGARSTLIGPNHIHTTACGRKPRTSQPALPLADHKGGPR